MNGKGERNIETSSTCGLSTFIYIYIVLLSRSISLWGTSTGVSPYLHFTNPIDNTLEGAENSTHYVCSERHVYTYRNTHIYMGVYIGFIYMFVCLFVFRSFFFFSGRHRGKRIVSFFALFFSSCFLFFFRFSVII